MSVSKGDTVVSSRCLNDGFWSSGPSIPAGTIGIVVDTGGNYYARVKFDGVDDVMGVSDDDIR